jgi:hypothetical protein
MRELTGIGVGNRRFLRSVRGIARDQAGIVTREQLLAVGVSASAVDRALRSGTLSRVHGGVYAAVDLKLLTEEGRLLGAVLAAGEGAILSHGTAAWRWRLIPAPPSVMQLAVPDARTALAGVTLHERRRLRRDDVTRTAASRRPPSPARSWTSPPATTAAPCCARWPKQSSTTTCAPPTSTPRCAAATPAAPTCAPRSPPTHPATAR